MKTLLRGKDIGHQHNQLRELLDLFEESKHLLLSSETAHNLLSDLFHSMIHHIETEERLLAEICSSQELLREEHHLHTTSLMSGLVDFNFELLNRSTKTLESILPQIRTWILEHEGLEVHSVLLKRE